MKKLLKVKNGLVPGMMLALTMLTVGCGKDGAQSLRLNSGSVVGGTAVAESNVEFKSVVGLVENGRIFCSGNVISSNKIFTAGHCATNFDITTRAEVSAMVGKVANEIVKESGTAFTDANFEGKRTLFKTALRRVIKADAKKIKIYVGSSKAGGLETGLDVVADVELPEKAYQYMEASVLKYTDLKVASDSALEYSQEFDSAVFTLKAPLAGVRPIPVISADEHSDNVFIGGDVRVVGFGLKVDRRFLQAANQKVDELKEKIKKETDAAKKRLLEEELATESTYQLLFASLYLASGNKNMVDLKLEDYDHKQITLTKKGSGLSGACNGDSGGPALVKLKNGQWRQLGVVVTVDYCGNKTHVSPQFKK